MAPPGCPKIVSTPSFSRLSTKMSAPCMASFLSLHHPLCGVGYLSLPLWCLCRGSCPQSCWARVRCGLVLSQDAEHAILPLQFELLQTLALHFLGTGHEPQIIICCKLCLILLMLLEQTTKLGMV